MFFCPSRDQSCLKNGSMDGWRKESVVKRATHVHPENNNNRFCEHQHRRHDPNFTFYCQQRQPQDFEKKKAAIPFLFFFCLPNNFRLSPVAVDPRDYHQQQQQQQPMTKLSFSRKRLSFFMRIEIFLPSISNRTIFRISIKFNEIFHRLIR